MPCASRPRGVLGCGSHDHAVPSPPHVGHVQEAYGALVLVDMDDVCLTNVNRQVLALTSTVGHVGARAVQKQSYMSFGGVGFRHMPDGRNPEGGTLDAIIDVVTDAWNKQQTYFGSDHGSLFATCLEPDGYCAGGVVKK